MGLLPHPHRPRVLAELQARPFKPVQTLRRVLPCSFQVWLAANANRAREKFRADSAPTSGKSVTRAVSDSSFPPLCADVCVLWPAANHLPTR